MSPLSLSALLAQVKELLQQNLSSTYWVVAEISDLKENASGHCFLELVEKKDASERLTARCSGVIWASIWRMLKSYFETSTNRPLSRGLKVLLQVTPEFNELYGFSLVVRDIDPTYTMGDLAMQRKHTIEQLKVDGVWDMNRQLELPVVIQRIAIVSSEKAAGLIDFLKHLTENPYGFRFNIKLFQAIMQGNMAEASIVEALDSIFAQIERFDVVVVIRGGGAKTDLQCFDSYHLASNIAQFPLPVLTGIGHEQDDSVVDMVAHTRLKTPTAVADFIVSSALTFSNELIELESRLVESVQFIFNKEKEQIDDLLQHIPELVRYELGREKQDVLQLSLMVSQRVSKLLDRQNNQLNRSLYAVSHASSLSVQRQNVSLKLLMQRIQHSAKSAMQLQKHRLQMAAQLAAVVDPDAVLKQGYSLSTANGKLVRSADELTSGSVLVTRFGKGKAQSVITEIEP